MAVKDTAELQTAPKPKYSPPTSAAGFAAGVKYCAQAARSAPDLEALCAHLDALAADSVAVVDRIDEAERAVAARVRAGLV